jgi:class 3 adenylate cyclase
MPELRAGQRASLPDSAFAYIDSKGRRRLPINDLAHVRNALARFNQTAFENEAARERARVKLLNAAKKFGIVPVGFVSSQFRYEKSQAIAGRAVREDLPVGRLTLMMTDIEGSTVLLDQIGDAYKELLDEVRRLIRTAVSKSSGKEVDSRADEYFAVFERAMDAVHAASNIQQGLQKRKWPKDAQCRLRIGIHTGHPTLTDVGYIGVDISTTARICAFAEGAKVVLSADTKAALDELEQEAVINLKLKPLGDHKLAGLREAKSLFELQL